MLLIVFWVIGITNLQSLLARLKALCGMCQFAASKSLVEVFVARASDGVMGGVSDGCVECANRRE